MDSVALVKYEKNVKQTLERGLNLIGGFGVLKSPVLIKPNICTITDSTGFSVSDVRVVEALVNLILEENQNLSINIVESDSESKWADKAFKKFGYEQIAEDLRNSGFDVSCVNLSCSPTAPVSFNGVFFKNPDWPDLISGTHYVISLAVAKTHYLTFLTGVLKNLFGFLPMKNQSVYHSKITEVIVDLNRFTKPNLCIVDARVGLEGWDGPKSRNLDSFILGHMPVSVDATLARLMGFNPTKIRHIVEASKYDLGTLNPTILGQNLNAAKVQFNPPRRLSSSALIS